ncbi:hypothetical protein BDV59DRAFT_207015 [Aspergillus ambiguus]|uniref:uncharacterized protein n=1 Tax=Aspergillus ambiguus TaxID=176160 RepID=UPI003CCD1962
MEPVPESAGRCRSEYFDNLCCQLQSTFPKFVANLQAQSLEKREQGRAAVLEYSQRAHPTQLSFHTSTELQSYVERGHSSQEAGIKRRLFILEDLPRNYIEVIGSQLGVNAIFFAAHWDDPAMPTFNYRSPFTRYDNNQFIIRYPSSHRIDTCQDLAEQNTVYAWDSNVNRHLYMYDPKGPLVDDPKSYHALSFWTTGTRQDGSWDAILLVDPPVGKIIRSVQTTSVLNIQSRLSDADPIQMGSLYPSIHMSYTDYPITRGDMPSRPSYMSLFDDIVSVSSYVQHDVGEDARSTSYIARKLVIAVFLGFLRRRYLNLLGLQSHISTAKPMNRCNYLRNFMDGSLSRWEHELFGFIVNVKFGMNVLLKEVEDNMAALGLNENIAQENGTIPLWERDGWTAVHEGCTTILHMADMLLNSYLQFVSIEEARSSNKGARSLARINILATLFIPMSTVASIFSMQEQFLPGRQFFWVFWVVSLPILLGFAFIYLKKPLLSFPAWIAGKKDNMLLMFGMGKEDYV